MVYLLGILWRTASLSLLLTTPLAGTHPIVIDREPASNKDFGSRTISMITNVLEELKTSHFHPSWLLLASSCNLYEISRQHCTNPKLLLVKTIMNLRDGLALFLGLCCLSSASCHGVEIKESQLGYPYCFYEMSKHCNGRIGLGCLCLTDIGMSSFAQCIGKMNLEVSKTWKQFTHDCKMATGSRPLWQEEVFQKEASYTRP